MYPRHILGCLKPMTQFPIFLRLVNLRMKWVYFYFSDIVDDVQNKAPISVQRMTMKLRTVKMTEDRLVYTTSDCHKYLDLPPINIQPSPKMGHLHFHRNRFLDNVRLWLLEEDGHWVDCTAIYARKTKVNSLVRHPRYPHLILSTQHDYDWAPSYILLDDYNARRHCLGGLNSPLVQRVIIVDST
jgi:hypothetical protein